MNAPALPIPRPHSLRNTLRSLLRGAIATVVRLDVRYVDPWERKRR